MQNQAVLIEKVRLLFPRNKFDEVIAILDDYGHEPWQVSKEWVQLAALKMSNGKLERLRDYMKTARGDYRDLLLVAREPNTFRLEMMSHFQTPRRKRSARNSRTKSNGRHGGAGTPPMSASIVSRSELFLKVTLNLIPLPDQIFLREASAPCVMAQAFGLPIDVYFRLLQGSV